MSFDVAITGSGRKSIKKLPVQVRELIVKHCQEYIAIYPFDSELLKSPLDECRSFHFKTGNVHYRIAYRIVEVEKRIDVVLVGTRENFYERLKRIVD